MKQLFSQPFKLSLLLAAALGFANAQAEVYRWVDENGKVHFSDRKPTDKTSRAAEDISEDVKNTNIDSSTKSRQQMKTIFAEEAEEEKTLREKERRKADNNQQRVCSKKRRELNTLRGRVYFVDKNGREYDISQKEQQRRVAEAEAYINKHCG